MRPLLTIPAVLLTLSVAALVASGRLIADALKDLVREVDAMRPLSEELRGLRSELGTLRQRTRAGSSQRPR